MTMSFTHETLPTDSKAAIRQMKQALRAQIGDVQAVFNRLSATIAARVAEINDLKAQGQPVWPMIPFSELAMGNISDATRAEVKRRGCAVIKGHFPRERALAWDQSMLDYLDKNHFDEVYKGPGDNFFGTLSASRPEIYPVYWSQAQMQARQSEEMALAQSFLNRLWQVESDGKRWFNPDISIIYPDRIRRRPPGTTSKGLGAHTDSGALERWLLPAYQQVFASVFNGNVEQYDPWNAAHRTEVEEYTVDNTTKCSVFRTFQGWT
ncbi:YbiU family protein, partial [Salmonella enterica]